MAISWLMKLTVTPTELTMPLEWLTRPLVVGLLLLIQQCRGPLHCRTLWQRRHKPQRQHPAQGGVPGFNPQTPTDTDPAATAQESFDEATPDNAPEGQEGVEGDEEVIDVDELVNSQKQNEEAIEKLTDKFEQFMEKFAEFQGELKANSEFMANLETEIQKRNPTAVEKLTMRSIQSKPFDETPEEYMKNEAPENYSPEDDNNGVGEPRYTITRDDVRNATDYPSIAKTLRDNENTSLKTLLGF